MEKFKVKRNERTSHWYGKDGASCHEVPYADPRKGMRATTVTDARKLGLVPSVTNILGVKAKPQLEVWKMDQTIIAALTLPRIENETLESFAARIAIAADAERDRAAAFGTALHDQVEAFCTTGAFTATGEILAYLESFEKWFRSKVVRVISAEFNVVNTLIGYAGRLDIHCILLDDDGTEYEAVVDIKSQKQGNKKSAGFYLEWEMQLAAYGVCLVPDGAPLPALVSLVIPSDEPGPLQIKRWEPRPEAFDAFKACHTLWCYEKGYSPTIDEKPKDFTPALLTELVHLLECIDEPPAANCSCHQSPPCSDCVDYSGLRESIKECRAIIAKATGKESP